MPTAIGAYIFAGGFTVGVKQAGFDVLCHLEGDGGYGVSTAKLNWPDLPIWFGPSKWPLEKIRESYPPVDFIYANPPCAPFSAMGIRITHGGQDAWRNDPRISCWRDSFNLLEALRPRTWASESVTQIYTAGRDLIDDMTKKALMGGYSVTHLLLDASWMGLPQKRKRFFLVAHRPSSISSFAISSLNWAPPPTVGEVLSEVDDPGLVTPTPERLVPVIAEAKVGEALTEAFDRLYPTRQKENGRIPGRPSFSGRKVPIDDQIGAFIGNALFHHTESRLLGSNEHKALCGYPLDFILDGPEGGRSSLLARAVMPPVGRWLAGIIRRSLDLPDGTWSDRTVTLVDLRKPDQRPVNLTSKYLDVNGRVRFRIKVDETAGPTTPAGTEAVVVTPTSPLPPPPSTRTPGVTTPVRPELFSPPSTPAASSERLSVGATLSNGRDAFQPAAVFQRGPPPAGVDLTPHALILEHDDTPVPLPGEGSGKFIQRLWRDTDLSPDDLVALVHANWKGRTTTKSDVYYNYRRLLDAGENIRKWPRAEARQPTVRHRNPPEVLAGLPPASQSVAPVPRARKQTGPRVVLTGFSTAQAKRRTRAAKVDKIDVPAVLADELEAQGVDLDWSPGKFGEERPFDAAIICLGLSMSIHGVQNAASSFWTLHQALERKVPVIIFFDDWKISTMMKHLEYVRGHKAVGPAGKRLWKYGVGLDELSYHRVHENILHVVTTLLDGYPPEWTGMFPRYHNWGDQTIAEKLVPTTKFISLDPTPVVIDLNTRFEEEQSDAWLLASLGDHSAWVEEIKPSWPVTTVGYLRGGQQRLATETDVRREGARHRGILAPPYDLSGSGWFRARFVYAALDHNVLHAGEADQAALGEVYQEATVRSIERSDPATLRDLAAAQAEVILPRVSNTRDLFVEDVQTILRVLNGTTTDTSSSKVFAASDH